MVNQNEREQISQISLSTAAARLNIGYMWAWKLARRGLFPSLTKRTQGKTVRLFVDVSDVEALLASREVRHG